MSACMLLGELAREAGLARADRAFDDDVAALVELHAVQASGGGSRAMRWPRTAAAAARARGRMPGMRAAGATSSKRPQDEGALVHARMRNRERGAVQATAAV